MGNVRGMRAGLQPHSGTPDRRRTSNDSLQASQMQVYCADLTQRCQALEGVFERLQSDSGQPRLSAAGASPAMQLDYQVTVTSPSRETSSASVSSPDMTAMLNGEAAGGRRRSKSSKSAGHAARRSSDDRGSGSWRISTHADLPEAEHSRGSLGNVHELQFQTDANPLFQDQPELDRAQQPAAASAGPQLAAAVRKIARLEDDLAESRGQTALLLQQVSGLHEDHDLLASMHDALESQVVDLSSMQARLVEAQQQLALSQQACHEAIAEAAQEHAGRMQSDERVQRLQAALWESQADCARLQEQLQPTHPMAEGAVGRVLQGPEARLDLQAASEAARQIMQILAGICSDKSSEDGRQHQQPDQAEPDLVALQDVGVNLAYEAASVVSQLRWRVEYRQADAS